MLDRGLCVRNEALFKIAGGKDASKEDEALGIGALGYVSGKTVKNQFDNGNITGRETMFHGAESKNIASIKKDGLRASHASDPKNITNKLIGEHLSADDIAGKVYLGRQKGVAGGVNLARMQNGISSDNGIVKFNLPSWKMNEVDNPEMALHQRDPLKTPLQKAQLERGLGRKGTGVFQQDIGAEFVKGKGYKKQGLGEFAEYVSKHPGRFSKGVGIAGLGVAGLGLTAALTKNMVNREKKAGEDYEMNIYEQLVNVAGFEKTAGLGSKITGNYEMKKNEGGKTSVFADRLMGGLPAGIVAGQIQNSISAKPNAQRQIAMAADIAELAENGGGGLGPAEAAVGLGKKHLKQHLRDPRILAAVATGTALNIGLNKLRGSNLQRTNMGKGEFSWGDAAKTSLPFQTPESVVKKKMREEKRIL